MSSISTTAETDVAQQLARLRQEQARLSAQLYAGDSNFRHLARSVWRVQEDERRRLARELHDGVGQNLTALGHRLQSMAARHAPDAPPADLAQAIALCEAALAETRALSRLLRPQILDDLGLEAALRWLARSSGEAAGITIEVEVGELPPEIDGEIATALFRVAQESLANATRHARAANVIVRLAAHQERLVLLVVDDGAGCVAEEALASASKGQSTGLAAMRERLRLFGGRFQFDSRPGEGTRVRAEVPIAPPERAP
jgi:two-component system sensor histidine kinase UhpB